MSDIETRETRECPKCGKHYICIKTPSFERGNLDDEMCPYCSSVNRESKFWHFETEPIEQPN